MKVAFTLLALGLVSCVSVRSVSDVNVHREYQLVGSEKTKQCTLKVYNIDTIIPTEEGLVETKHMGTQGLVCGVVDCTKYDPTYKKFDCIPAEYLLEK